MARQVKNREPWHLFTARADSVEYSGSVVLVGPGPRSYLWVQADKNGRVTFSGRKTLRALALAILKAQSGKRKKGAK